VGADDSGAEVFSQSQHAKGKMMKKAGGAAVLIMTLFLFLSCSPEKPETKVSDLSTFEQKISYVFGREVGLSFREAPTQVDLEAFMRGIQDAIGQKPSIISLEEEEKTKMQFSAKMQEEQAKRIAELADKNLKDEESFLARNQSEEGVVTTASGLQYQVLQDGAGAALKETDRVKVHYRGVLIDGTEFDSSYSRNEPAVFEVNGVIPGWAEGLQLMRFGGKYKLWIPSKLAYGARGAGRSIGPNALLIFDVEPLELVEE
jgi:FKBP-type peptidyl-prolyl cis-trans isomerase